MLNIIITNLETHKDPFTSLLYSSLRKLAHVELENNRNKNKDHSKLHYGSESCNKNAEIKDKD